MEGGTWEVCEWREERGVCEWREEHGRCVSGGRNMGGV